MFNKVKLTYTTNHGNEKTIDVYERCYDKFVSADGKERYLTIDRSGQYPVLKQCVMGKCGTVDRQIGRYPEVQS